MCPKRPQKGLNVARSHFSYEKRRKELDKKKKKEAKRQERLERKALKSDDPDAGGPPISGLDEYGNPIPVEPDVPEEDDEEEDETTEP